MSADTSSSTSAFVTTLIFNGIIGGIFLLGFLTLRQRYKRVYEPRTLTDIRTLFDEDRTDPCPPGYFQWLPYLLKKPHSFIIQHAGIDGYFYLRFLGVFAAFSLLSAIMLFPILLPVNITNGNNLKGFEIMSFANVKNKNRFYAHVFLSWLVFGLLLFIIYKELYYYTLVRHAAMTTPLYDGLLSSHTVIVTELDDSLMQEGEFERLYPSLKSINYAYDLKELNDLVEERQKDGTKLESAVNSCVNKATKKYLKKDYVEGKPQDNLDTYVPYEKRPKHRLGKWFMPPLKKWFGREKVQTITYCGEHISELNEKIHPLQQKWTQNEKFPSIFIQFGSQLNAQKCYQSLEAVLGKKKFGKKFIGATPKDINWTNMSMTTKERHIKRILANTFLTLLIIFWAIPVAVVGCISNVNFLTDKVHFLRFINNLPNVLMGLITGILPTVALAVLMSLVAPIITKIGNISGAITFEETSLYVQKWYYAFQVVDVFIVVTLASSASATVDAIIKDPTSAMTLLAANLPKASNFYIVYFLLLGLTTPAGNLLQIVTFILSKILHVLDNSPRAKWTRYNVLSEPNYGVLYPAIQILTVIMLSYTIIAPIILVFTTLALITTYVANLYNLVYVTVPPKHDLVGKNYPYAIFQVFVGIYLAQVCLIGLFIMAKAWGPLVLECFFLVVTALTNIYFKRMFLPVLNIVPLSAIRYARGQPNCHYPYKDLGLQETKDFAEKMRLQHEGDETGGIIRQVTRKELVRADLLESPEYNESSNSTNSQDENEKNKNANIVRVDTGVTTEPSRKNSTFVSPDEEFHKLHYSDIDPSILNPNRFDDVPLQQNGEHGVWLIGDVGDTYRDIEAMRDTDASQPGNSLRDYPALRRVTLFFKPWDCYKFPIIRQKMPVILNSTIQYDVDYLENAYIDSSVNEQDPIIWVAKDPMGVSDQLVKECKNYGVDIRNEGTTFTEKGKCTFTDNPPDYEPKTKL
ncbi:similar to Saccharomyces cerevisiae YOL084W PHM7 Protein of unknown function, expression is regulated by phosphate levels [Maudiozyma barnettii]|uniref:CSC1/OSCA1-like 7TM region domain-containing protein n=1 Tax=Maudiozyma barnettii TaxID=61262 RepID=A0A8H2ZJK1_9SACH|nr:Phm7p [Kazachstania barnettii]CAB4256622.1 similar to Saccharomyces cerevisiae YOL084W PHM7 Protein of unknown function, expression is regulated by phosphate levels [Kazachstania barnettii]CAD1785225.1 similar to Saccharomyces cerevisiae YOL084W PHM7 Protein of unknown function, expression is regulated by phosphate levels [Kazachstania barnettii]